jgi:hypothetical protein
VTDVTKVINGVNAVVIWDRDFQNGALVEEELALMAQDDAGIVWSLGEYPEETGNGRVSAPSVWLAGNQQAIAGLLMRADPQPNTSSYLQGKAPAIQFLDQASVTAVDQQVCIIPGIGVGQVVGRCGVEQEALALIEIRALDAAEMTAATTRTLQLDQHAYTPAKAAYTGSPPAVVRPPAPVTAAP